MLNTPNVKCGKYASESFPVKRGVKQGDILSPMFFNIFINDVIPLFQEPDSIPPKLKLSTLGCLLYADDLVILSTSQQGLQASMNKLQNYCEKWKLEVNMAKSKVMCLKKGGRDTKLCK